MSWTQDFGTVEDAAELRKHRVTLTFGPGQNAAEKKAALEMAEAAKEAAAKLLESPSFADYPCAVFASGQANPDHEPRAAEMVNVEVTLEDGEVKESPRPATSSAIESVTVTITQQPPPDFDYEV